MKEYFLFRKFSSKSLSNVSSDPGHRWSIFRGDTKKNSLLVGMKGDLEEATMNVEERQLSNAELNPSQLILIL